MEKNARGASAGPEDVTIGNFKAFVDRVHGGGRSPRDFGGNSPGLGALEDEDGCGSTPREGFSVSSGSWPGRMRRAEVTFQPVSMPSRRKRTRERRRLVGGSPREASWSVTRAFTSARSKMKG